MTGCANEFNAVYKSADYLYKYEYAKQCYTSGKYTQATTLLSEIITMLKGTDHAEESLYLYAMSLYKGGDYELASDAFKRCYVSYPKGQYTENAYFYAAAHTAILQSTDPVRESGTEGSSSPSAVQLASV